MNSELFNMLLSILTVVITVCGGFTVNFIRQKISNEKLQSYYIAAKQIIMFIEQSNPDLINRDKKDLAVKMLLELSKNKITKEQANMIIESAVYEVKKLLK